MTWPFSRRSGLIAGVALLPAVAAAAILMQPDAFAQPAGPAPGGKAQFKTFEDKLSYGLGLNIGRSLKNDGLNPNPEMFAKGLKDAMGAGEPALSDEELQEVFAQVQKQMMEKQQEMAKAAGATNAAQAKQFLADNKKKEGVKETASGLQYKVVKAGNGGKPKATDVVKVHYHGTLPDGTVFDSSVERGEPTSFPLNRVIKGWTEGVQLMPVGSKYTFYVPPGLAYGEQGSPPVIGPNQLLVFDVELLDIVKPAAPPE